MFPLSSGRQKGWGRVAERALVAAVDVWVAGVDSTLPGGVSA